MKLQQNLKTWKLNMRFIGVIGFVFVFFSGEYKHCTWSKTSCIIRHLGMFLKYIIENLGNVGVGVGEGV